MKTDDRFILLILMALGVAFVPLISRLPLWVTLWCLSFWGYRAAALLLNWPLPARSLKLALTITGILFVGVHFGIGFNRDTAIALLAIMISLKPFEIRSHRDRMVSLFLGFFVVINSLLFSGSLLMTLYMFISVVITSAVLVHINHPAGRLRNHFATAAGIMGISIPLMVFLFFLFPRMQGSLWGFSQSGSARTGFSNQLSPGTIAHLVRNNAIAFRVEFKGPKPAPEQLYWRGLVFSYFDGNSWKHVPRFSGRVSPIQGGSPVEYTVILEPHQNKWLFALDIPVSSNAKGVVQADHTLAAPYPVRRQTTYQVLSVRTYRIQHLSGRVEEYLQIPLYGHESAKTLAQDWSMNLGSPQKIIQAALTFFRQKDFTYTLNPPLLTKDPIDQFLFETRQGYCEHFASAFAVLMRAAGIPARIIGGYLGGEVNPYGDYLIVRQADAHAWVEVWLQDRGWIRVDPTAVVAPARLAQGMLAALPPEDQPELLGYPLLGTANRYLRSILLGWDALNNFWSIKIIGYSFKSQKALLQMLGLQTESWQHYVKLFAGIMLLGGALVFAFTIWIVKKAPPPKDEVLTIYQKYCSKLSRAGIPRSPAQGPFDYACAVISRRPDLEKSVQTITAAYIRLRYRAEKSVAEIESFKKRVHKFKPARAAAPGNNAGK